MTLPNPVFSLLITNSVTPLIKKYGDSVPIKRAATNSTLLTFSKMNDASNTTVPFGLLQSTSNSYCVAFSNAKNPAGTNE